MEQQRLRMSVLQNQNDTPDEKDEKEEKAVQVEWEPEWPSLEPGEINPSVVQADAEPDSSDEDSGSEPECPPME
jgi:hypothetical protein